MSMNSLICGCEKHHAIKFCWHRLLILNWLSFLEVVDINMEPIHAVLYSDRHPLIWARPGVEAVPVVKWELPHPWASLPPILLAGGTSPGDSAPAPGAARRFLQQDMHHFTQRLHLTPSLVVKIMDVTLLYLCSSPNIVINPVYYTNAFAWHIDFVVLETKNLTGAEKKGIHNPQPHPLPPSRESEEKNAYVLTSMLEHGSQFTKGWLPFHPAHQDQYNCRLCWGVRCVKNITMKKGQVKHLDKDNIQSKSSLLRE